VSVRSYQTQSPTTVEWYTPPAVFAALGLNFDLDPAAPPGGVAWVPAARSFSRADDGLSQPWSGRVWLNPPYGAGIGAWLERLADHGDGMALVFARTDTQWYQRAARRATAVCFVAGRLAFVRPDGSLGPRPGAPAPSVLFAYGLTCAAALCQSRLGVTVLMPRDPHAERTTL
jgi:hypothetical protein